MREDIKIEINGKMYVGWEKISKKVKISASLLRVRVNKLGWNMEKAVNTSVRQIISESNLSIKNLPLLEVGVVQSEFQQDIFNNAFFGFLDKLVNYFF